MKTLLCIISLTLLFASCKKSETVSPPVASFTVSAQALLNEPIQFTSTSTGAVNFLWSFGDGDTSTLSAPIHTYTVYGMFTVTLTATNTGGASTATKTIKVLQPNPVANFSSVSNAYLTQPIIFTSQCQNADSILWYFGDSTTAKGITVSHSFPSSGTFNVKLTAKNSAASDFYSQAVTIKAGKSEYNAVNKSSISIQMVSFFGGPNSTILDWQDHGTIATHDSSSYVFTSRSQLYLGLIINSKAFICIYPFHIADFSKNHLTLYDTTMVYGGDKLIPHPNKSQLFRLHDLVK